MSNPCNTPALDEEASNACYLIENPSDAFGLCSRVVNSTRYFEECKRDYCAASKSLNQENNKREALCNSFAAMGAQCSDHFLNVEWRTSNRCRKLKCANS